MLSHETLIKTCDWQWTEACKRCSYCYSKNTAIFVTCCLGVLTISRSIFCWTCAQARPLSAVQLCCTKCRICIPLLYSQLWMPRSNGLHWCELSAQHWVHQRVSLYVLTAAKSKPDLQQSRTDFLIVFEQNLCVCHWDNDFRPQYCGLDLSRSNQHVTAIDTGRNHSRHHHPYYCHPQRWQLQFQLYWKILQVVPQV